jgi:predicted transcriptional regulator
MAYNDQSARLAMTTGIVANYVQNNRVSPDEVAALITRVHAALAGIDSPTDAESDVVQKPTAAQIRKSIRTDGLISFIDGRKFKALKRHLTTHGMTPAQYRERFSLPADYPIVSSAYSATRSALAKASGLGAIGRNSTKGATAGWKPQSIS